MKENVLWIVSLDLDLDDETINSLKRIISDQKDIIIISPSSKETIDVFYEKIGRKIDIYSIDNITCKTIIRANPGFLRLKKGVVVEKFTL